MRSILQNSYVSFVVLAVFGFWYSNASAACDKCQSSSWMGGGAGQLNTCDSHNGDKDSCEEEGYCATDSTYEGTAVGGCTGLNNGDCTGAEQCAWVLSCQCC